MVADFGRCRDNGSRVFMKREHVCLVLESEELAKASEGVIRMRDEVFVADFRVAPRIKGEAGASTVFDAPLPEHGCIRQRCRTETLLNQ